MGAPIEPNRNCPNPKIVIGEYNNSEEGCWAFADIDCPTHEPFEDCLEGLGHCYYEYFASWCEAVGGDWYRVHCFYTYVDDDCEEPGGYSYNHENDIPRLLLFDYGTCDIPGTKYELYDIEGSQQKVIAFRNPKASMNLKIKFDPSEFAA